MLQFIKKLWAKGDVEVVLPKEIIPFSQLLEWMQKHTTQANRTVSDQATPLFEKLDDILFAVQRNITKLEHAALRNKNISGRELEIMKGNRNSYVQRTRLFIALISSFSEKETKTYDEMKDFVQKYTEQLQPYHDATIKPYAVLQHFFANEAYAIAKNIKEIDEEVKQLQLLLQKQSVEAITSITQQIKTLQEKFDEEKKLKKEKKELEEEHDRLVALENQALERRKKIEEGEGYKKYCSLVIQAKECEKKCLTHIDSLKQSFSVIDKALRKYGKLFPDKEETLNRYIESPFAALEADAAQEEADAAQEEADAAQESEKQDKTNNTYAITRILQSVREQLLGDALDIKDEKKEKIAQELEELNQHYFENFLKEHAAREAEKKQYVVLCGADFANQQYKEAVYMHTTYKEKAAAVKKERAKAEEKMQALAIFEACRRLQEDVAICTKRDVEIVFQSE